MSEVQNCECGGSTFYTAGKALLCGTCNKELGRVVDASVSNQNAKHPAVGLTSRVEVGNGAVMTICDPAADTSAEWTMRYGVRHQISLTVATLLASYDYLLSDNINMAEATRRLRLMRVHRKNLAKAILRSSIAMLAIAITTVSAQPAKAEDLVPGPVPCELISVYDGDTFTCSATPWPDLRVIISVRTAGFDTPEMRGKCESEKAAARKAKSALQDLLSSGNITLRNVHLGKYAGRVVAEVFVGGVSVSWAMIESGNAVHYDGGKRQSWCDDT